MPKVACNVDTSGDRVVIAFTDKIAWFEMTPHEAVEFAKAVVKSATKASRGKADRIILPHGFSG